MEKAGDIGKLCCPPYDIISDSEREEFIKENPYNIIRLELPKGENPYEVSLGNFQASCRENFRS